MNKGRGGRGQGPLHGKGVERGEEGREGRDRNKGRRGRGQVGRVVARGWKGQGRKEREGGMGN